MCLVINGEFMETAAQLEVENGCYHEYIRLIEEDLSKASEKCSDSANYNTQHKLLLVEIEQLIIWNCQKKLC